MEKCDQKVGNIFDRFDIATPCSAIYFLEVGACVSYKVATKQSIRGKRNSQNCASKAKTEESHLNVWNIFNRFGITIPCSTTYALEVGARDSLKVATRGSIRGEKPPENLDFSVVFL